MRTSLAIIILLTSVLSLPLAAAENWQVRMGEDGMSSRAVCLLESASVQVHDGQTTTPVKLLYNGELLIALTKSNIDLSYQGVGLQVDGQSPYAVDSLHKETRAIFNKQANDIMQAFIKGREASLVLGFWPTWPKTKTVSTRFSLLGFSRAYQAFLDCQANGDVKK